MRTVGSGILIVLAAVSPGWGQQGTATPSSSSSPGNSSPLANTDESNIERPDESEEEKRQRRRFEKALEGLGTAPDATELKRHLEVLGRHFDDARPMLAKAAKQSAPRVRALVMKLYGDHGNVDDDLDSVVRGLDDPSPTVRMAVVAALRRLGKDGSRALLRHLPRERDAGIRKMAVRTLKMWKDPDAIPSLARLLPSERHPGVRKHLVRALEWLSGKRYGDDPEAWLALAEEYVYQKNEKRILEYSRSLPDDPKDSGKPRK